MTQLEKYSGFNTELALAETLDEIKAIETRAAAAAEFARREKIGVEEQNKWGRFRIQIEQKKGQWLEALFPQGGDRKSSSNNSNLNPTMADEGIKPDESANARLLYRESDLTNEAMDELESKGKVITPHAVSRTVRKKKQERYKKENPAPEMPNEKYRVIYADPPWQYGNTMPEYFTEQGDHYALMTVNEIALLPVESIVADNAVLFLWVTSPILEESFDVVRNWGFQYKSAFIWDKIKHNMGHYNSVRHEILLICVRGSCQPDVKRLFDSVQSIERTKHSKKPEKFREIIDTIYPEGRRIELFAREKVENWDAYGNEIQ
jgi:N6-adenosine-specific RNA methylase IME4